MVAHCIEAADMNDNPSGSKMINEFKQLKGSLSELLGSADHAALLFIDSNICGNAYLRGWWGSSVSTSAKGCALGYYTMVRIVYDYRCYSCFCRVTSWATVRAPSTTSMMARTLGAL